MVAAVLQRVVSAYPGSDPAPLMKPVLQRQAHGGNPEPTENFGGGDCLALQRVIFRRFRPRGDSRGDCAAA